MGKVLTLPGIQPPIPKVPEAFEASFNNVLGPKELKVVTPEDLSGFFMNAVEWSTEQLGITLNPDEKIWLSSLLAKCKDFLSVEKALVEIIHEASQVRGDVARGLKFIEAGNLGLMASGGFVNRRHFNEPAYYADQAAVAYWNAGSCLKNSFFSKIAAEERVPLLSSVIRLIRVLCGNKGPFSVYEYVNEVNPPSVRRGFHLNVIK